MKDAPEAQVRCEVIAWVDVLCTKQKAIKLEVSLSLLRINGKIQLHEPLFLDVEG